MQTIHAIARFLNDMDCPIIVFDPDTKQLKSITNISINGGCIQITTESWKERKEMDDTYEQIKKLDEGL